MAGLLTHLNTKAHGEFTYRLALGVEMGRPSALLARAEKSNGAVTATRVGGSCVMASEGFIHVDKQHTCNQSVSAAEKTVKPS